MPTEEVQPEGKRKFEGVWIPREIWLHPALSIQEKCMIVEINSLDHSDTGGRPCFASNKHFSNFLGVTNMRCSQIISSLKDKGFISVKYNYETDKKNIKERLITITDLLRKLKGGIKNTKGGYKENVKDRYTVRDIHINKDNSEFDFEKFLSFFEGQQSTYQLEAKWIQLSDPVREAIAAHLPKLKAVTDDQKFFPGAKNYLNSEGWKNPVIDRRKKKAPVIVSPTYGSFPDDYKQTQERIRELNRKDGHTNLVEELRLLRSQKEAV